MPAITSYPQRLKASPVFDPSLLQGCWLLEGGGSGGQYRGKSYYYGEINLSMSRRGICV